MNSFSVKQIIEMKFPKLLPKARLPRVVVKKFLQKILYEREIIFLSEKFNTLKGFAIIDELFEYLNFSFKVSNKDLKKIPSEGRLICVSNHPIGSLDGLALLQMISMIRSDVQIVANDFLMYLPNFNELFLPFELNSKKIQRKQLNAISEALSEEKAVIIFPAGEVSRMKWFKILDGKWSKGAIHFSKKTNAPILPVYIKGRNSLLFYFVSALNKPLSTVLLIHELFNKRNKEISFKIGDSISAKAISDSLIADQLKTKLLKKHTYLVGKGKKGIFNTEKNVIHPTNIKKIYKEIKSAPLLNITKSNMRIVITNERTSPNIMREISRLREITFRKVGEGTGKKKDIDKFDCEYDHLVIWDENELEIVGSYRIGNGAELSKKNGDSSFYTSTLFEFNDEFRHEYLSGSIELGRSFVQQKYWNTNSLNYLWMGIGAYLVNNPQIKYMFGPVSISNSYPKAAQEIIVFYFSKWFGTSRELVKSRTMFKISKKQDENLSAIFTGKNVKEDYFILKKILKNFGFTVPVLYKHYTDLCEEGGAYFAGFNIDESFGNCVDGFIVIEVDMIKPEKRERFMKSGILTNVV